MNISKKNLEILIVTFIGEGIDTKITNNYTNIIYWGELLIDLNTERKYINIHFQYCKDYKKDAFINSETDIEIIEFSLNSRENKGLENLDRIEKETHINKNSLYTIIEILEEL